MRSSFPWARTSPCRIGCVYFYELFENIVRKLWVRLGKTGLWENQQRNQDDKCKEMFWWVHFLVLILKGTQRKRRIRRQDILEVSRRLGSPWALFNLNNPPINPSLKIIFRIIGTDGNEFKIPFTVNPGNSDQCRKLNNARTAPGSPNIDHSQFICWQASLSSASWSSEETSRHLGGEPSMVAMLYSAFWKP